MEAPAGSWPHNLDTAPSISPSHPPVRPGLAITAGLVVVLLSITRLSYMMNWYSLDLALAAAMCVVLVFLCFVRLKLVLYVLIFACLFSPELRLTEMLGRASKRAVTIRVEDILLVVVVIAWLARTAAHKELGLMLRTPLNKPMLLYALACAVATAAGIGYGWVYEPIAASLFVLKYIQYFVLFFMIVNHIDTPRDVRNLVIAGVLTYLAVCAYGFIQIPQGVRPSTFAEHPGEPNTLAGYLLLMRGVCSGLLLVARRLGHKLWWGALFMAGLVLLAYTLSRSGWAGLAGLLAVLVVSGRHRLAVLGGLLVIAATLVLLPPRIESLPSPVRGRVRQTVGEYETWYGPPEPVVLFGWRLDASACERYRAYEGALKSWAKRCSRHWVPLLTGSGVLGAWRFVDGQYVRVLVETGLLGLLTFLALLVAIWRHVWRSYKVLRTPWYKGLALGYLAGFAGLLVHALGANTFIIVRIMEPFFILTGVVVLLPMIEQRAAEQAAQVTASEKEAP